MAENFINRKPQLRGTAAAWTSNNTVLLDGEWGLETDTNKAKFGDGVTAWNSLPYFGGGGTQTWEETLVENATATTKPLMTGGASVGDGASAVIEFNDGNATTFVFSTSAGLNLFHDDEITMSQGINIPKTISSILDNKGDYDADTNTPTLSNLTAVVSKGIEYTVSVAGTQDFGDGDIIFSIGDVIASNGVTWYKKVDNNQSGGSEIALYSATTTGTVTLDCSTFDSWYRILTGNTDFQFSNTPASGETFVKTLEIITTAGETLTFSTADKVTGTLTSDNTTVNLININLANYPTLGLRITVNITQ